MYLNFFVKEILYLELKKNSFMNLIPTIFGLHYLKFQLIKFSLFYKNQSTLLFNSLNNLLLNPINLIFSKSQIKFSYKIQIIFLQWIMNKTIICFF